MRSLRFRTDLWHTGTVRARILTLLVAVAAAVAVAVPVSTAQSPARAHAEAAVVSGSLGDFVRSVADGDEQRGGADAVDERGITVADSETSVRTSTNGQRASARASASARSISLLGGLVTAYGARRTAVAEGGDVTYTGRVQGLKIRDESLGEFSDERRFELNGQGVVDVNRDGVALRVKLTKSVNGFAAGTEVRVADVQADAEDGEATPTPTPTPTATDGPGQDRGSQDDGGTRDRSRKSDRGGGRDSDRDGTPKVKRRKPPNVRERLTGHGYAFPVFGNARVADDFGAPRQIGAHQGNDIFAPFGAPALAVADGVVEKVGTLPISGNRLWLRTDAGDAFFYAHMSAFSPEAVNGRRVKAGTVLGFVGNTGDAEPTPPHLHFEIHPGGEAAIDPHRILLAWQQGGDVPPGAWLARYGEDTAPRPGALVEVRDFIAGG